MKSVQSARAALSDGSFQHGNAASSKERGEIDSGVEGSDRNGLDWGKRACSMTPRLLLRGTALAAAAAAALSVAVSSSLPPPSSAAAARAASPPHPHILFITADDLGYNDLGALNGGLTITPAIDALRATRSRSLSPTRSAR